MKNELSVLAILLAVAALVYAVLGQIQGGSHAQQTSYERVTQSMTLRCGWMLAPPFVAIDPKTNKLSGFDYDYVEAMGKLLGLKITWQEILTGQQVEALRTHKIDAVCGGEAPMVAAQSVFLRYSDAIAYFPINMYVRAKDFRFDGSFEKAIEAANVPGVTVAFLDGDTSQDYALQLFPNAKKHELPNAVDFPILLMDVATGKADFVLEDPFTAGDFMRNNPGTLRQVKLDRIFAVAPNQISVLHGDETLIGLINQGISLMRQRGLEDRVLAPFEKMFPGQCFRIQPPYMSLQGPAPH